MPYASDRDVTYKRKAGLLVYVTEEVVVLATAGGLRRYVRYLRRRRGWNQQRLAASVGRTQQWVSSFERGHGDVSVGDVLAALSALGASVAVRPIEAQPDDGVGSHG